MRKLIVCNIVSLDGFFSGRAEGLRDIVHECSGEASYITGTTLTPDGGFTPTNEVTTVTSAPLKHRGSLDR